MPTTLQQAENTPSLTASDALFSCTCCSGVQDVVRFTNNIEDNNRYFPRGGPGNRGGDGEKDLCG
jgi:hypothetical protein